MLTCPLLKRERRNIQISYLYFKSSGLPSLRALRRLWSGTYFNKITRLGGFNVNLDTSLLAIILIMGSRNKCDNDEWRLIKQAFATVSTSEAAATVTIVNSSANCLRRSAPFLLPSFLNCASRDKQKRLPTVKHLSECACAWGCFERWLSSGGG